MMRKRSDIILELEEVIKTLEVHKRWQIQNCMNIAQEKIQWLLEEGKEKRENATGAGEKQQ
jgi:hypothetical protein